MPKVQRVEPHTEITLAPIEEHQSMRPLIETRQALIQKQHHVQQEILTVRERYRQVTAEPPQLVELRYQYEELGHQVQALTGTMQQAREDIQRANKQALLPSAQAALETLLQALEGLADAEQQVRDVMHTGSHAAGSRILPPGVLDPHLRTRMKLTQRYVERFRTMSAPAQEG